MPSKSSSTTKPILANVLSEDTPIAGQKYGCFSFISPEKILKQREEFLFEEFVKQWDMAKSIEKIQLFTNFIAFKYKLRNDDLLKDLEEFIVDQKEEIRQDSIMVANDYKTFTDKHGKALEDKFNEAHNFQTSTRGLKQRGNFDSEAEANMRAKMIREVDPAHDVLVGPIGVWMPWDPDAYKTGRVEYLEEELNTLVHEKMKNENVAKMDFEARIQESKRKAFEDNLKNANNTDASITQSLDDSGNLIGSSTQETEMMQMGEGGTISTAALQAELFEGDNIVTASSGAAAAVAAANAETAALLSSKEKEE